MTGVGSGANARGGGSGAAAKFTAAIVIAIAEAGAGVPSQDVHLRVRPGLRQSRRPATAGWPTAGGGVTKQHRSGAPSRKEHPLAREHSDRPAGGTSPKHDSVCGPRQSHDPLPHGMAPEQSLASRSDARRLGCMMAARFAKEYEPEAFRDGVPGRAGARTEGRTTALRRRGGCCQTRPPSRCIPRSQPAPAHQRGQRPQP